MVKLKCECGMCRTCYIREYMRKKAKEKVKLSSVKEKYNPAQEVIDRMTPKKREKKQTQKVTRVMNVVRGIHFLQVVDYTKLGLDISIFKEGRTAKVFITLKEKDINVVEVDLKKIKERESIPIGGI